MKYNCEHCNKEFKRRPCRNPVYCSVQCQTDKIFLTRYTEWIIDKHNPQVKQMNGFLRRAIIHRDSYKCSECGVSEWNNKPITLEVEHKDGKWDNNTSSNLCLLCPNCHSQTPTFRAKNKGNGRPHR